MSNVVANIFRIPDLRRRIIFTVIILYFNIIDEVDDDFS